MAGPDDVPRHDDPTEPEPRPHPRRLPHPARGATLDQLRRDIDSGATGEKVPMFDPTSAPLGTDGEAAGAPPTPEMIAAVRQAERTDPNPPAHPHDHGGRQLGLRLLGGLLLAVALAGVAVRLSFA